MAYDPIGNYSSIYDIPKSGSRYKSLKISTVAGYKKTDPVTGKSSVVSGRGAKYSSSKDPDTGKWAKYTYEPSGTHYSVSYRDKDGREHKGSLDSFMKKDFMSNVAISEVPDGYKEYKTSKTGSYKPASNFTNEIEGGFKNVGSEREGMDESVAAQAALRAKYDTTSKTVTGSNQFKADSMTKTADKTPNTAYDLNIQSDGKIYFKKDRASSYIDTNVNVGRFTKQKDIAKYWMDRYAGNGWQTVSDNEYKARQRFEQSGETPDRTATGADITAYEKKIEDYMTQKGWDGYKNVSYDLPDQSADAVSERTAAFQKQYDAKHGSGAYKASGQANNNQFAGDSMVKTANKVPNTGLTIEALLADQRVKNDKGVNGTTMAAWLQGNEQLLKKLAANGYNVNDLVNEAYAQTRYNTSAFAKDMTQTVSSVNSGRNFDKYEAGTDLSDANFSSRGEDIDGSSDDYVNELLEGGQIDETQALIMTNALSGIDINTTYSEEEIAKIASDAEIGAQKDLDPYYDKVKGEEVEDLRNSYADMRGQSLRYQQQEAKSYKETLATTKQNLRASGMTFSGASRQTLGAESAIGSDGIEGELPQERKFNWEDKSAAWQQDARDIGTSAERELGSAYLDARKGDLGENSFADPYKDSDTYNKNALSPIYLPHQEGSEGYVKTGGLDLERKRAVEVEKQRRIALQRNY